MRPLVSALRALATLALGIAPALAQPVLQAPANARAGANVSIQVTGTVNPRDFLSIVPKASREGFYDAYRYAGSTGAVTLVAPNAAGDYEVRLLGSGSPYPTLARTALRVEAAAAALEAPAEVRAGAKFQVHWSGPANANDYIGIGETGPKAQPYISYARVGGGSPVTLAAPDRPGEYEIRYFLGGGGAPAATRRIKVAGVAASLQGPADVRAGESFAVQWQGPNNGSDYITIVPRAAHEGASGNYAYAARGNPARIQAPLDPGDYELRYSTGQSHATLARASIRVTAGRQEPGLLRVTSSAAPADRAVEVILDASGSMLLAMGSQRRIDVAKQTLTHLTSKVIPAGTPFALRIFGREVDSCQTDLDVPLGPLDPGAVAGRISALQVKNRARTPIGASLDKAVEDLAGAKGERLVILLTDGEETCGGDPAGAIERLLKAASRTRVNIVGFAIDDRRLEASFRHWARAGNGEFFSAKDAAGLAKALREAMRAGFEVLDAQGQVVAEGIVDGEPVRLPPGAYQARVKGGTKSAPAAVQAKQTLVLRL